MVDTAYSGGFRRILANIIDGIITGIVCIIFQTVLATHFQLSVIFGQFFILVYYVMLESFNQASIGKMALGIYVAKADGTKMSPDQVLLRYIVWILPVVPLIVVSLTPAYADITTQMKTIHDPKLLMQYMQSPEVATVMGHMSLAGGIYLLAGLVFYFLPMFFTKQKTGLHDIVAKARVFKKG